jgi:Icc-related predicted phosphoesterase
MKIQLMSDLHLEFEPTFRPKNAGADVLILSGDICMASYLNKSESSPYYGLAEQFREFFAHCSAEWANVIYIMGNHEHYRGYIDTTADVLREALKDYPNIHFLDGHYVDINDVRFVGGTLWTDLNGGNPVTENYLRGGLNDFRLVQWKKDYTKFTPMNSAVMHSNYLRQFSEACEDQDRVVVCSHHAPSFKSVHPKYHNDTHMNGGYFSHLDNFILDRPQIKLWTHGHMHDCFDYDIGTTRVLCNPRGYSDENKYFNPGKVVEV